MSALSAALLVLPAVASAAPAIANGSFEVGTDPGVFATLSPGDPNITDWSVDSGSVDYIGSYWSASNGVRSLDMNGLAAGTISQSIPTVAGATYTVTFDLSGNPDSSGDLSLTSPSDKVLRVSATGATSSEDYHYDTVAKGNTKADMMWEPQTYTFTATGAATTLTFASQIAGAFGPALDNVAVTESLPPVACFVGTGGKGLGFWANKNGQAMITGSDLTTLSGLNLRNANGSHFDPATNAALKSWLLSANATNMAYMLSAQLAAAQLSVLHGTVGTSSVSLPGLLPFAGTLGGSLSPTGVIVINDLIAAANASLGLNPSTPAGNAARAYQEALKNALEKVASGASIQLCEAPSTIMTFTATDSSYYNGPTSGDPLYATGPINFTWDSTTGSVTGGLYKEIVPPTSGTHYFNDVTGGTVSGGVVSLTFLRAFPSPYGPFTFTGTLAGGVLTGTLDGPYYFTATGVVTP